MQQSATARQLNETICLSCGKSVSQDVATCPNCGSRIAGGPAQPAMAAVDSTYAANPSASALDQVGPGRYVLNFFLAGLLGLGITYFMRKEGWTATFISGAIFALIVVFIALRA